MRIQFSRHAKRRAKLYNIKQSLIIQIVQKANLKRGNQEIVKAVASFKYPLKIVVAVEEDKITVITTYPLKKGRKQ